MECGWISIHRKIKDHWIWEDKPFSKGQAWIDILLMANHAERKVLLGNELIIVKRGMFITSEKKLMENWGWSKSKVRAFLETLEKDSMIERKIDKKKTTINVANYGFFQDSQTTERPQKDHRKTTERPQTDTNNNDNNYNNENNANKDDLHDLRFLKFKKNLKNESLKELNEIILKGADEDLFLYAIDKAKDYGKENVWPYIREIVKGYMEVGIYTAEKAREDDQRKKEWKESKKQKQKSDIYIPKDEIERLRDNLN